MSNLVWVLLLVLVALLSFVWGAIDCVAMYRKRAESGKPFTLDGKVYVMREVEVIND